MLHRVAHMIIALALVALIAGGCSSQAMSVPQTPATPNTPTLTPTIPAEQPSSLSNRVDVIYFHRPQRCVTCLCFEERIRYVVSTYFQNELKSGKMTFGVYNIGDSKNATLVKKYLPITSSLYINTVKDDTDDIKNIEEIWSWNCRGDKEGFDQKVKSAIEQSFKGLE